MPSTEEEVYYVAKTMDEIQKQVKDLYEIHHTCSKSVSIEIAKLDVKSGIWFALAGAVPGVIALVMMFLKGVV